MFAGPLGRSTFTPPKSSFDSPLYGLVSLRRSQVEAVVEEYVRGVEAGAAITHIHGVRRPASDIGPDGRKVSRLDVDGWKRMQEGILSRCDAVMQFGVAGGKKEADGAAARHDVGYLRPAR